MNSPAASPSEPAEAAKASVRPGRELAKGAHARLGKTSKAVINSGSVSRNALIIDRTLPPAAFEEAKVAAEYLIDLAEVGSKWTVVVSHGTGAAPLVAMTDVDADDTRAWWRRFKS